MQYCHYSVFCGILQGIHILRQFYMPDLAVKINLFYWSPGVYSKDIYIELFSQTAFISVRKNKEFKGMNHLSCFEDEKNCALGMPIFPSDGKGDD